MTLNLGAIVMTLLKDSLLFSLKSGFVIFLVFLGTNSIAQQPTACDYVRPHEADNWTFGQNALLDFFQNNPESKRLGTGSIELAYGCASISDTDGNLLFFTDGIKLYSSGYYLMDNTDDLTGISSSQSSIFVPVPGNPDKYYLFTVQMYLPIVGYDKGVNYSIIEKIDGLWKITTKNEFLFQPNAQKITAVKKSNQKDFWVVIHGYDEIEGKKFIVYEITETGLNLTPVHETSIGYLQQDQSFTDINNNSGYMKFSPDGSKIALAVPYDGIVEVFDFNNESGDITGVISSQGTALFESPYGIEFSPDNTKLYVSTSPTISQPSTSSIFQFEIGANMFTNFTTLYVAPDKNFFCGAMQLGVDGKIYISNYGTSNTSVSNLSVVENPNRVGLECNLVMNGLALISGTGSLTGLPNIVTSFLDIPHLTATNLCATEITYFNLRNETNVGTPDWDFGDGGTASGVQSQYIFDNPGKFTVNVTETYNGVNYPYSRDITIYPLPSVNLGENIIYILPNTSVTLDAGEFDYYLWEPGGSTDRYLDVSDEGIYIATVTDTNCCVNSDTVEIKFAKIYFPNAFRPTSSIVENQTFKAFGATSALLNFDLKVFNRWGQLVFNSNDPDKGWDGTFSGGDAPNGVYAWVLNFNSTESRYQAAQSIIQSGTVTLLR